MLDTVERPREITTPRLAGRPPRVLVVDDSRTNTLYLSAFLSAEGYSVRTAANGAEALELAFTPDPVDLVLMDVVMPVMDGIEAAARLKALSTGRLLPVLLVSSLASGDDVLRGLESGADDYLVRPINLGVLRAKLRSWLRTLDLNNRLGAAVQSLREHQAVADTDLEIATSVIGNLVQRKRLSDPVLTWMVRPSARFSGDIVAAERPSPGLFYALIADATGHGLGAAISLLPVLQVFYGMARKGLPLPQVAAEMNQCLRQYVPAGQFVAATLLCADEERGTVSVWNGGMPSGLTICEGMAWQDPRLVSRNMALGILGAEEFNAYVETIELERGASMLFFSDGLPEALNPAGEPFGEARVHALAAGGSVNDIVAHLEQHLRGVAAHDDVSLMMYQMPLRVPV